MKTIFEGVVNNEKFDNVKDYNEAVQKALEAGEPFNASSSTKTVQDDPEPAMKADDFFLPLFNGVKQVDISYIQPLANISLSTLQDVLNEAAKNTDIKSLPASELSKLVNKVNKIILQLRGDHDDNKADIDKLHDAVEHGRQLLKYREELGSKIAQLHKFYKQLSDEIEYRVQQLSERTCQDDSVCGCRPADNTAAVSTSKDPKSMTVNELLKYIFE